MIYKKANHKSFSWWNYVNMKSDIQIELGFAKFFYPEIIEIDNCIFIKDNFSSERYEQWKVVCNDKKTLEKAINSYEIKEFFHMNTDFEDKNINEQIQALGNILKKIWTLGFNERFPDMNIVVDIIEDDESLYITVFQDS